MKASFNVNCPLTELEAMEIINTFKDNFNVELYCGINQFIVINLGKRSYKYSKNAIKKGIVNKINYMINNNI